MAFGLVDALAAFGITVPYVWTLPLASFGLAWVFPSLFMLAIGAVIQRILTNKMKKI
jgi:branched-subunit amino acid permease